MTKPPPLDIIDDRVRVEALAKIVAELEFAVSQLQAPNDAKSASTEDRVQWAYRRGARDAYLEVIKALQEIKLA